MYKRYSRKGYASRRKHASESGWKRFCVLGTLAGIALMCNILFRGQIQSFKSQLTNNWEEINYRAAFSAIGRAVKGEDTPSEAWAEVRGTFNGDTPVHTVNIAEGSGEAAFARLESGSLLRKIDSGRLAELTDKDNSITFDFSAVSASTAGGGITNVSAYDDGIVLASGDSALYGKYLIIMHGEVTAQYFHCSELFVKSGSEVIKGEIIAEASW